MSATLYPVIDGRIQTRSLEVHIVDHCNLRCASCCSLSPFLPKWWIDPVDMERDLILAKSALSPTWFKLVGGEPLLHPAIDECLAIANRVEIAEIVSVTTNGFLLPRMTDRFWQLTDALTISLYPNPVLGAEIIKMIEQKAAAHEVMLNWKQQDQFVDMDRHSIRENHEATIAIYNGCWLRRRCHIVSRGSFYTCTRPPHFQTLHGGDPSYLMDGIPLHSSPGLVDELLGYLARPDPLKTCALCNGGNAPEFPHRQLTPAEVGNYRAQ